MTAPIPNAADRAEAELFVRETYDGDSGLCRAWLESRRAEMVGYIACAAMQKRQDAEFKACWAIAKLARAAMVAPMRRAA